MLNENANGLPGGHRISNLRNDEAKIELSPTPL
jgi:hypothetical protein